MRCITCGEKATDKRGPLVGVLRSGEIWQVDPLKRRPVRRGRSASWKPRKMSLIVPAPLLREEVDGADLIQRFRRDHRLAAAEARRVHHDLDQGE